MYQCRTCQHTEVANSNCVYRNVLKSQAGDTAGVTQDVALDPTVGSPCTASPPSPSSAFAMCGCCGQIIMCSDCEMRPAFVPADESDATLAAHQPSTPPKSYQAELVTPMLASTADGQGSWSRMLEEVASLNLAPVDADTDADIDYDMDDWEPEMEDLCASREFHPSPGKAIAA